MSSETQLYTELFEDEDEFGEAISPDDAIKLQVLPHPCRAKPETPNSETPLLYFSSLEDDF